jgi:two-component sensor histidine kinase
MYMVTEGEAASSGAGSAGQSGASARLVARDSWLVSLLSRLPAFRSTTRGSSPAQAAFAYGMSLLIIIVAVVVRFVIDPYLPPGFPYLTFFPAIILTGFFFGMRPALLNTVICAIVAWYWFIPPVESFALTGQAITALAFFFLVIGIDLGLLQLLLSAYAAQVRAREDLTGHLQLQQLVSEEVDHRLKNLLATTSGLISLSQRYATTPQELGSQLKLRIQAMGHSITLLRGSLHGGSADMREAILAALEPLGITQGDRLSFEGPRLNLSGATIISLSLIMHELGTNAFKYGALSQDSGQIAVTWRHMGKDELGTDSDDEAMIELVWQERGGPPVSEPTRHGFGNELVRRMATSFGGECRFDFAPEGLSVRFHMRPESVLA